MPDPIRDGLPEGVKFTGDFHPAGPNDYEMIRDEEGTIICKGVRAGAASGVKVVPADGWVFIQDGYEKVMDIRSMESKPGRPTFKPARLIPRKEVTLTVKCAVGNELDATRMEDAIKAIPSMAGYQSMERQDG